MTVFVIGTAIVLIRMHRRDKDHDHNMRQYTIVEQTIMRIMHEAMQEYDDDTALNEAAVVINAAIDAYNESLRGASALQMKLEHFRGFGE
jgi:hypothetical protein